MHDLFFIVSRPGERSEKLARRRDAESPQALNETRWQVRRVLDFDDHGPAIKAVVFQVLVKLGIAEGNDVASEIFWLCKYDRGHSVVVMEKCDRGLGDVAAAADNGHQWVPSRGGELARLCNSLARLYTDL